MAFGCVAIAERHVVKNSEHQNLLRKMDLGAEWFISQAVYDVEATIKLLYDYGDLCRARGVTPKKIVLTFAPCGRKKTMAFIKWLGIKVPPSVEDEIFSSEQPTQTCVRILCDLLTRILRQSSSAGVSKGGADACHSCQRRAAGSMNGACCPPVAVCLGSGPVEGTWDPLRLEKASRGSVGRDWVLTCARFCHRSPSESTSSRSPSFAKKSTPRTSSSSRCSASSSTTRSTDGPFDGARACRRFRVFHRRCRHPWRCFNAHTRSTPIAPPLPVSPTVMAIIARNLSFGWYAPRRVPVMPASEEFKEASDAADAAKTGTVNGPLALGTAALAGAALSFFVLSKSRHQ